MSHLSDRLRDFGALDRDCVDLRNCADPRLLRYADLIRDTDHPLVDGVVEQQNQALLYVIDHAQMTGKNAVSVGDLRCILAMRGDPAWLGVLSPGRLDIYATDLRPDPNAAPQPYSTGSDEAHAVLPRLAQGEDLAPAGSLMLREVLLDLMTHAGEELRNYGLSTDETIALAGRALFFRYLIGRKIVGEAHRSAIAPSAPTLKECFSTAASLAETNLWLDITFNGDLLRLPDPDYAAYFARLIQTHGDRVTRPLRAIMGLDQSKGPGISQIPLDWDDLDFNHLPIGLLSETYETLIQHLDQDARRDTSVYYTPAHIAEYMVEEALHEHPDGAAARVLDPACGAGVFLVACFRKLAELHFKATGKRPSREALRAILDKQLTGFDTNAHARTLAALALYLTALELDPDPTPLEDLKFNKLEDRVLVDVADPGSAPDVIEPMAGSLGAHVSEAYRGAFDLVIGNPPWTSLKPQYAAIDREFTRRCRAIAERRGFPDIARDYKNPDKVPDLPFLWGAMEWARPGGRIALALAGRWLFKMTDTGFAARRAIFRALAITGILNGTSLRQTAVWPNTDQPFCLLFADNRIPREDDEFVLVSPEWEPELNGKGRMRIDALDAIGLSVSRAADIPYFVKTLYRGSSVDLAVLEKIKTFSGLTIGAYWKRVARLAYGRGYEPTGENNDDSFLKNKPSLLPEYAEHPFTVLVNKLDPYVPRGLHRPRDPRIYDGPLVLIRETNRPDRALGRALYCAKGVAYTRSYYGFSTAGHAESHLLAMYLLVLIHSRVFEFHSLMTSGKFGFEREVIQVLDVNMLPFRPLEKLSQKERAAIQVSAEGLLNDKPDWDFLDGAVARLYGLSELDQQTIADTLSTRAPFATVRNHAGKAITAQEAETFRVHLETELGNVLAASGHRVMVSLLGNAAQHLPWRFLGVSLNDRPIPHGLPTLWLDAADDLAASRITLVDAREPCLAVGLLDRYRYWTPTQARLLASDLLWQHGALLEERAGR